MRKSEIGSRASKRCQYWHGRRFGVELADEKM
jgi:hypothetical protein